jgi:hypothetical protein
MIIGGDFNSKCRTLLLRAAELTSFVPNKSLRVEDLNFELGYDRKEIAGYLEYLKDRQFILLTSIGGPLLYGHIELTQKGVKKARDLQSE